MKKIWSCILVMVLLASCVLLAILPASASPAGTSEKYKELFEGDNELTRDELVNAILSHMLEEEGALQIDELRGAAHVYVYWDGEPKTIKDSIGRKVTIYKPIERIAVTDDNHAELIRLLGAETKVVGIEGSIPDRGYFPVMSDKPDIGNQWSGLNYELIAELNPDVVIMLGLPFVPVEPVLKKLDEIGVTAVCIDPIDIDKRADVIMLLGNILEETERATDYCEWREEKLGIVSSRLEGEKVKSVVAKDTEFRGYFGKGYTMTKTIERAGMSNIANFTGIKEQVDLSWILEAEPEVFILGDWESQYVGYKITSTSNAEADINDEIDKPGFEEIPAVKNGSVYEVEYMLLGTRGDIGVLYLAKMAHPEKFPDNVLDPVEIHREYFEDWLRVDYQGIFFYPQTWEQNGGD